MGHDQAGEESGARFIDEVCGRFEAAWQQGRQPRIEDFLLPAAPDKDPATLHRLLVQLVGIDLERRWRTAAETAKRRPAGGQSAPAAPQPALFPPQPRLADYVARYPALGPLEELPLDLIADEYYARCRYGDRPTHAGCGPTPSVSGRTWWRWVPARRRASLFSPWTKSPSWGGRIAGLWIVSMRPSVN